MGTHALIGFTRNAESSADSNGAPFSATYLHWDGFPTTVGPQLAALIARDGLDEVLRVLLVEHTHGWSVLDPDQKLADEHRASGELVVGYGDAYVDGFVYPVSGTVGQPLGGADFGFIFTANTGEESELLVLGSAGFVAAAIPLHRLAEVSTAEWDGTERRASRNGNVLG